jgi:outer membrane receptor protein involved in Fe transport
MVYANAAKGYRAGGVNSPLGETICGQGLANVGLTVRDVPTTFGSDTVWSYEVGAKGRAFGNRLQVNASAFRIDWTDVQLSVQVPGCGQTWNQNAGTARSEGFDVQAQARLFRGLTLNVSAGYTKARYTTTTLGPKPISGAAATPIVREGDTFPIPPWQVSVGGQYEFRVSSRMDAYIRADYQYASGYFRGPGPGVNAYNPYTRVADNRNMVNARAGVTFDRVEVNVFVNNLLDSMDQLTNGGGPGTCSIASGASCSTFSSYNPFLTVTYPRPRQVGIQTSYRF